ncbi:MAG: lipoprotein-releasing system ATP-binding protein LolD [Actinobacteria bacterium HGW-Actinobacteria-7]|jgi:putative ABC transport system ATP-binding protein|nr:MAG: lipoprotein-releasing system ATP-binding protein LolD [Actinobacteria bacterium HGW-Actinobacteria-7]
MAIVEARGLTKVYGTGTTTVTALDHVDLAVQPGEFVAVMGPSGCGKSTLLNLLGGLDTPSEGTIEIDGEPVADMNDDQLTMLRRRRFGFVFQFFNLIPVLNATENAALPLTLDGVSAAEARTRAEEWLRKVGLEDRMRNRPDQLSGGQQQRVAVARALVTNPALLLADEPTGNLDSRSSDEIAALLKQASEDWGRAILMVTHDIRLAAHAHRIVFMQDGRIVDDAKINGAEDARKAVEKVGLL